MADQGNCGGNIVTPAAMSLTVRRVAPEEALSALGGLFAAHQMRVLGVVCILAGYVSVLFAKMFGLNSLRMCRVDGRSLIATERRMAHTPSEAPSLFQGCVEHYAPTHAEVGPPRRGRTTTKAGGALSPLSTLAALIAVLSTIGASCAQEAARRLWDQDASIEEILDQIPEGSTWQSLDKSMRAALEKRALDVLARDRVAWGPTGLDEKLDLLVSAPTDLMAENIDRVLGDTFASELATKFKMSRDVTNADLRRQLLRVYLTITDSRGYMLLNHPEYGAWDGKPVRELYLIDHEHYRSMAEWNRRTETELRKIPDGSLTDLERKIRDKAYFTTRAGKHFDRPALGDSGAPLYSNLYEKYPFLSDGQLLDAYNVMLMTAYRDVNIGTKDAFDLNYDSEFNNEWLESQKIPPRTTKAILKLGNLFRSKIMDIPDIDARCTHYSEAERAANWDAATAEMIANADGSETLQSYAKAYDAIANQQRKHAQTIAVETLKRLFPDGSPILSSEQRARVSEMLLTETRPAMMINTLIAALDQVTGFTAASKKVNDAIANQPMVGGDYSPGAPVREEDRQKILEMWSKARNFISREYSGYRVDIAKLIPIEPIIVTTGDLQFTVGGEVNLSLQTKWNLASLSSTILHEMKHAVDQNSHAPVEGAAWEGAATSVERQVWPLFIEEAMAGQGDILPLAILKTEVDNVRFPATTEATLKIFLRESCDDNEPNTIQFAKDIVRSYGYTDENVLQLRSRRAHRSTQYLEYGYGLRMYTNLLSYLQQIVGPEPRVDAYLLQACRISNPKQDQATADDLKGCIRDRKN